MSKPSRPGRSGHWPNTANEAPGSLLVLPGWLSLGVSSSGIVCCHPIRLRLGRSRPSQPVIPSPQLCSHWSIAVVAASRRPDGATARCSLARLLQPVAAPSGRPLSEGGPCCSLGATRWVVPCCIPSRRNDPLLAKLGQNVQHRPWPGTARSQSPPKSDQVQARWCRLWVSMWPTRAGAAKRIAVTPGSRAFRCEPVRSPPGSN